MCALSLLQTWAKVLGAHDFLLSSGDDTAESDLQMSTAVTAVRLTAVRPYWSFCAPEDISSIQHRNVRIDMVRILL